MAKEIEGGEKDREEIGRAHRENEEECSHLHAIGVNGIARKYIGRKRHFTSTARQLTARATRLPVHASPARLLPSTLSLPFYQLNVPFLDNTAMMLLLIERFLSLTYD